jgi:hypothetical protein
MADTTEKIIFSVQIDQSDAIAKVAGLTKEINALKDSNKQLALAEGDNSKAIAENNILIQAATNERRKTNSAIVASVEAFGKEAKSIDDARAAVKQLTIERNKLDLSTDAGKAKQKELNASIDQHNKFIKENVDQYQQQKINIGNYAGALKDLKLDLKSAEGEMIHLAQTLGRTSTEYQAAAKRAADLKDIIKDTKEDLKASQGEGFERLGSTIEGLKGSLMDLDFGRVKEQINQLHEISKTTTFAGMIGGVGGLGASLKTLATTILTNPIFILAAVVGGVAVAFKGFYDSLDAGKEILKIGKESVSTLKSQYDELAQSMHDAAIENDILTGKISKGTGDRLKNQDKFKQEYLKIVKAASDEEKKIMDAAAKEREEDGFKGTKNLMDRLGFETATTKAASESISAIEKQKQENILLLRKKYSLENTNIEIETTTTIKEENKKKHDDFIKKENEKIAKRNETAKKIAEINNKEQDDIAAQIDRERETQNAIDNKKYNDAQNLIQKTFIMEESERIKNLDKSLAENAGNLEKQQQLQKDFGKQQLISKAAQLSAQINLDKENYKDTSSMELELTKLKSQLNQEELKDKEALAAAKIAVEASTLNAFQSVADQVSQLAAKNTIASKTAAIASTTINTYESATAAYTAMAKIDPFILAPLAAGLAVAAGLANVANIMGVKVGGAAAGGGDFMTNGPTMLLVGDNPGGRERVTVEPISGKGQTTINPNSGLVAMAGGGSLTTSGYGGYAERNGGLKTVIDYNLLAKAMQKSPSPIIQISELNKKQASLSKVSKTVNITD